MSDSTPTLYYVHDPMCSWCWGFRPVWLELKQRLDPTVDIISLVGGLAGDSDEPMPTSMQSHIQETWRHIQQCIPGTEFNYEFWTKNKPRRSTYPACRAVICAREMADKAEQMTLAIQQAYYVNAQNPSDLDTLEDAATSIGLDRGEFARLIRSAPINDLLASELAQVRQIGVSSFPSLVIKKDDNQQDIPVDYTTCANMLWSINQFLNIEANH